MATNYGIVELLSVAGKNVDAYNHTFKSDADDIENGSVFTMGDLVVEDGNEIYKAVKPATANLKKATYIAASPIRVVTELADGSKFVDLTMNPKAFINKAGQPIDGVLLQRGDKIRLSKEAVGGSKGSNKFIVATDSQYKLQWAASEAEGALSLALVNDKVYFSIPTGEIGSQRAEAYDFIVL